MNVTKQKCGSAGFTLVELAISLMIIGLLIGGVLKGEELMDNARVTTTVKQVQSYRTAYTSFENAYGMLPGDMVSPTTRLPNCTTAPCSNAVAPGDEWVGAVSPASNFNVATNMADTSDNAAFWWQLSAAGLINFSPLERVAVVMAKAPWDGAFGVQALNTAGGDNGLGLTTPNMRANYLFLKRELPGVATTSTIRLGHLLRPGLAEQIDRKLDDGMPAGGEVLMASFGAAVSPITGSNYNTLAEAPSVNLAFKLPRTTN